MDEREREASAFETKAGADAIDPAQGVAVFVRSELFDRTFREGMELVEAAAAYLDGEGRRESKLLSRDAALAYAGESMRLTTRLMQVASWLLVQRAVRQGDMAPEAAREPRYRLDTPPAAAGDGGAARETLPGAMRALAERSERLFDRVRQLDLRLAAGAEDAGADEAAPSLPALHARLRSAFGG